jgi:hypothetical protein
VQLQIANKKENHLQETDEKADHQLKLLWKMLYLKNRKND